MSETEYPREVTKDNIKQLHERAEAIKKKNLRVKYVVAFVLSYFLPAAGLVIGGFYLVLWLLVKGYLDFLLIFSPPLQVVIFFILLFTIIETISLPTLGLLLFLITWLMRKYIGYLKYEEVIFSECFIIAIHLMKNERMKAKNEVGVFLAILTQFSRDLLNPKRKVYGPEFTFLRRGKTEISRMLMFSRENISNLLMNFGLAFLRDDDPEAYEYLAQLLDEVAEYGEPKGRLQRFLGAIETYPQSLTWILTTMIFIVSLLLTIFGYRPPP